MLCSQEHCHVQFPKEIMLEIFSMLTPVDLQEVLAEYPRIGSLTYGTLENAVSTAVDDFVNRKPKHSLSSETKKICSLLIRKNTILSQLDKKDTITVNDALDVFCFLKKLVLW